ncbi:hypothetical protein COCON_G00085580 [Conger conger]|uniref:UBZ4-type domain-containing protein n=1 Tax=Conger conger TaxID=82655 RepID=A0A9Q1DQP4_CONCO|nr:hypothetical protein COCON_G00085580 [Conger conger]
MEVQEEEEEEEQGPMEVDQAEEVQVCGERVECPICMRHFPLPQIEMHAAYCDGSAQPSTPDDSSPVMVLRKGARRPETTEEDQPGSSKATQEPSPEKCFLCQGQFPVKEYRSHVDACLRLKSHPTQGAKSLLTALERSEQKESEAGPSQEHSFSHAAPADADQSGDSGGVAFSNSPIKSFTPISQVTDCLVDFKRQYSAKPSQRAGRKRKHR